MTRMQFVAIAETLRNSRPEDTAGMEDTGYDAWLTIVENMANTLAGFNSNFDRGRFLAACGYDD